MVPGILLWTALLAMECGAQGLALSQLAEASRSEASSAAEGFDRLRYKRGLPDAGKTRLRALAIYGEDDRVEASHVRDPRVRELARSVLSLFFINNVSLERNGRRAVFEAKPYGEEEGLCRGERFYGQRTGSLCSGVLVGPDLLATAGHCLDDARACGNTLFVFGFEADWTGWMAPSLPAGNVYRCRELVARWGDYVPPLEADWALVRLDRPVAGAVPARLNRSGVVREGAPLLLIGNPKNLPLKVSAGGRVRDASPRDHFVASVDGYHGNSGSPVFNRETGLLEGLLIRGEDDFVEVRGADGSCYASKVCPEDGCRGEDVTRVSEFAGLVPEW